MSMDTYAAHLYGTAVDAPELLSKFENKNIDFYIIRDDFDLGEYDNYPKIPENIKDVEIIWGPDDIIYFGYSAIMPYKKSVHTKKEMDKNIYDFVKYFCGKNIADNIEIVVLEVSKDRVKLGITAPKDVKIIRNELRNTQESNLEASKAVSKAAITALLENAKK